MLPIVKSKIHQGPGNLNLNQNTFEKLFKATGQKEEMKQQIYGSIMTVGSLQCYENITPELTQEVS